MSANDGKAQGTAGGASAQAGGASAQAGGASAQAGGAAPGGPGAPLATIGGLAPEAVEFQPDALEIQNERLPRWLRHSAWFAVAFLAAALIWACVGQVDVVVQAPGKLVTDEPSIVMKPLERAVIKKIHVKIGDVVAKDAVLITFDPALNQAEAERLTHEVAILSAQFDRLLSEYEGREYAPRHPVGPSALSAEAGGQGGAAAPSDAAAARQLAIFRQRAAYFRERNHYFDEGLKQLDASKKSCEDALRNQSGRLESLQKIEAIFKRMHDNNAASLKELLTIGITRMEMEAAMDEKRNQLLELGHQRASLAASRATFIEEWRNNVSEELVRVGRELTTAQKSFDKVKQLIEYVELRAPCNCVVHEIAAFSVGSAVQEAEALITLIPLEGKIELEAEVSPQDIAKVRVGSEARVKLNAWPFQQYGTLDGKVRNVSENTIEKPGVPQSAYYRVRAVVSGQLKNPGADFRLIPGMEAVAEIKCGRRRIIEFVLYPLLKALDETAREP